MNISGLLIGAFTFFIIGLFHVVVVKAEFYFSKNIWPLFLIAGAGLTGVSFCVQSSVLSAMAGILGMVFFWSIKELFEQEKRVEKGWAKRNPDRLKRFKEIKNEDYYLRGGASGNRSVLTCRSK